MYVVCNWLPQGWSGKEPTYSARDTGDGGLIPGLGRSPWRRKWQPTPVFLPGESLWTEEPSWLESTGSDMTEQLSMHACMCASLVTQLVKNRPAMRETWVRSLGWEDSLENKKTTHSSIQAWKIPWTV